MSGLLQVSLFPDETLPSWVARVARANGKLSAYSFCGDIGVDFAGMMVGRSADIGTLASATGRNPDDLTRHALMIGQGHRFRLAGEAFSKLFMRKHQLAFCPRCFAQDDARADGDMDTRRYWRKSWLLNDTRVCTLHGCRIESLPPHSRTDDLCRVLDRHDDTVTAHIKAPAEAEPTVVDRFISERLAGHASHGDLLDQTELGVAIHMARLLGVAWLFGARQPVSKLSDEEIGSATSQGMSALLSGTVGVREALDTIVIPGAQGVHSAYGRLPTLMNRQGDSYNAFKKILVEHASGRFAVRNMPIVHRGTNWTSISQVARATGLSRDTVKTRLYERGIIPELRADSVPVSVLELFPGDPAVLVRAVAGRDVIGCDSEMFDSLVDFGLIKRAYMPARKPSGRRNFKGNFDRKGLVAFRRSVEAKALSSNTSGMISLRQAARLTGLSKAQIISNILSDQYRNVALSGNAMMADNVMIDPLELRSPGDTVTATQASVLLDVRNDTFAKLLAHGIIPYSEVRELSQRFPRKEIRRRDIEAFAGKYVSIAQLVRQTGLDRNAINAMMKSRNIRPAFPPAEFRAAFILRSKVAKLLQGAKLKAERS